MVPLDRQKFTVVSEWKVGVRYLERSVVPAHGSPYSHRCRWRDVLALSVAMAEAGEAGFTVESVARAAWGSAHGEGLDDGNARGVSRAATLIAFLRSESALLERVRGRRWVLRGEADDVRFEVLAYNERDYRAVPPELAEVTP